ncbi:sigma-70 family RNA polymerase sigma factor [Pseudarthrobacter sp. J1738]|uniref:sigma-70 family RNA polymerase sigma factor n=1 Tax=Pseudarthrobacter sp. J1738 TaxID=3420446 RepID=UPI003D29360D
MLNHATPSAEPTTPSDAQLIALVREDVVDAYGELFARHHGSAVALARRYARNPSDAQDLAAEAFAKVLTALKAGAGPKEFFRAYLFTTIAHLAARHNERDAQVQPGEDMTVYKQPGTGRDTALESFEARTIGGAYQSLPERWQAVLWYTEIDAMKPAAVAPLLGLSANAVSALALRAREGLRQAYLQEHINVSDDENCQPYAENLGAYARGALSGAKQSKVREHLDECNKCTVMYAHLTDVGAGMRTVVFPLVAGLALSSSWLVRGGTMAAFATGLQQATVRSWDWLRANSLMAVGTAVAVTLVLAGGVHYGLFNAFAADNAAGNNGFSAHGENSGGNNDGGPSPLPAGSTSGTSGSGNGSGDGSGQRSPSAPGPGSSTGNGSHSSTGQLGTGGQNDHPSTGAGQNSPSGDTSSSQRPPSSSTKPTIPGEDPAPSTSNTPTAPPVTTTPPAPAIYVPAVSVTRASSDDRSSVLISLSDPSGTGAPSDVAAVVQYIPTAGQNPATMAPVTAMLPANSPFTCTEDPSNSLRMTCTAAALTPNTVTELDFARIGAKEHPPIQVSVSGSKVQASTQSYDAAPAIEPPPSSEAPSSEAPSSEAPSSALPSPSPTAPGAAETSAAAS